jgi:hypothetical protein
MVGGREEGRKEGRKEWSQTRRYGEVGEVLCSILGDSCDGDGCSCCEGGCGEECVRESESEEGGEVCEEPGSRHCGV